MKSGGRRVPPSRASDKRDPYHLPNQRTLVSEVESVVLERRYGLVSMTQTNPNKQKKITRQYHFAFGGVLYVAVTTLLMLGALNSQNNLLFAAMGVSIGGLVVSGILSGWALLGVRVERISVSDASVGRPMTIRVLAVITGGT